MLRSLHTGISGLRNHQVMMDVTSHNIANVNTNAYKAQRVTFKEGFSQMLRGATRPAGDHGGVDPMQIGLGMAVGSIDNIMDQGSFQSTGQVTDLAVEGRGFFAFTNGRGGTFYGRNGAMQLNADGYLVSNTNGFHLLGLQANSDGVIPHTALPSPIKIPFMDKAPARATEQIDFACNLDAEGIGRGTWQHTAAFLTPGAGGVFHEDPNTPGYVPPTAPVSDLLTGLHDTNGNSFNMQHRDVLNISFMDGDTEHVFRVQVGEFDNFTTTPPTVATLQGLTNAIGLAFADSGLSGGGAFINANGGIDVVGPTGISPTGTTNLVIKNETRPTSNNFVANTFQWPGSIEPTAPATVVTSIGRTLAAALEDTPISNILDSRGQPLRLENGDPILVNASIGNVGLPEDTGPGLIFWDGDPTDVPNDRHGNPVTQVTTMRVLMDYIQMRLRLPNEVPNVDGTSIPSVEINNTSGDTRAPIGSIVIRGQAGESFAITGLTISAQNSDNDDITPSGRFNNNTATATFQQARDTLVHSTSIEVFDESGAAHTVMMTFTHSGTPGKWLWELTTREGQLIAGGNRGTLYFSEDGSPSNLQFDDGSTAFRFNPRNGSAELDIRLNIGQNRSHTGLTQFKSATTSAATNQDGYPMGKLMEISITEKGEIQGLYTTGLSKTIARILLAEFNNNAGLLRAGDSMWAESHNSGEATLLTPGDGTQSSIKPGAIEMSNVDLAGEFTQLITTQRGYQANARIISTSDSLLQELVNLVR